MNVGYDIVLPGKLQINVNPKWRYNHQGKYFKMRKQYNPKIKLHITEIIKPAVYITLWHIENSKT